MNDSRLYSFIGLMQKAGKISSGDDAVEIDIKKRKAELVIIATDASENTKKKFINMCEYRKIEYVLFGQKDNLGQAIGKSARSVIAVKDKNFAAGFKQKLSEQKSGGEVFGNS
ncbi:Ribosomal protein L7Ae [Caloramator fervidus]|uniref:Ribosomal protein L7Ae n=1 Tax=Caloramator fervidus TaxID=29344 RepID=A0A1H5S5H1_9CLOT|nr:ribosomal L7Ae/L30e/S12e/Gadd45 family protein [Caloramator fervidus]SEF45720.1 Ribosomal protein L7Ae [Caloramator fervidus]